MHLHALEANTFGPPPANMCTPVHLFIAWDPKQSDYGTALAKTPMCENAVKSPLTSDELMNETLTVLKELNITGLTSGDPKSVERWKKAGGDRILPATDFYKGGPTPAQLKTWIQSGRIGALAEVGVQYQGVAINSPLLEPYFELAEQLDVPVGIHMGPGPPGAPYLEGMKPYRARLSSLLLLEDVLVKHPKLRVWAMHAGWPLGDDAIAALYSHPQLYVDVGVIDYFLPRAEFYRYLQRLVEAGFENRIMFGSDQMVWPEAIRVAINSIQAAPFLSEAQKRDILYNNAARFLRMKTPER
jgi:uncharacterized protein